MVLSLRNNNRHWKWKQLHGDFILHATIEILPVTIISKKEAVFMQQQTTTTLSLRLQEMWQCHTDGLETREVKVMDNRAPAYGETMGRTCMSRTYVLPIVSASSPYAGGALWMDIVSASSPYAGVVWWLSCSQRLSQCHQTLQLPDSMHQSMDEYLMTSAPTIPANTI